MPLDDAALDAIREVIADALPPVGKDFTVLFREAFTRELVARTFVLAGVAYSARPALARVFVQQAKVRRGLSDPGEFFEFNGAFWLFWKRTESSSSDLGHTRFQTFTPTSVSLLPGDTISFASRVFDQFSDCQIGMKIFGLWLFNPEGLTPKWQGHIAECWGCRTATARLGDYPNKFFDFALKCLTPDSLK